MRDDSIDGNRSAWVKSTKTAFEIVEALRERDGAGVTELADALDLSKSAVHKHLQTLLALDYVVKDGTEYRLGLGFLSLGSYVIERTVAEFGDLSDEIDTLAENARLSATLVVPDGTEGVVLYRASSIDDERFLRGDRFSLPSTASGISILAHLPDERRDAVLDRFDEGRRAELERDLRRVRDQRLAFERERGGQWQAVAAPVLDAGGSPVGAVSAAVPTGRVTDKRLSEDIAGLVLSAAKSAEGKVASAGD